MPGTTTRGKFYFVPSSTPALPFFHDFYSATWTHDDVQSPYRTGPIQDAPRPWTNGHLGITRPPAVPLGGASAFEGDLVYPTDVNKAELREGIPVTCWTQVGAPFEDFDVVGDVQNCCLRNVYAQIINLLYAEKEDAISQFFLAWLGPAAELNFFPLLGLTPAMLIVKSDAYTMVFCAGTDNKEQFIWQAAYGLQPPQDFGSVATSQIWFDLSTTIADRLIDVGTDPAKPIFLAGHSYGGAGVSVLAVRLIAAQPTRVVRLLTWGAPKFTDIAGMDHIASIEFMFVIDAGDPVPQAPLSAEQIAWFGVLIPANVRTAWAAWAPAPIYLVQDPDGTKTLGPLPSAGVDFLLPFVVAWLTEGFIDPAEPHYIPTYIARGCLRCHCPRWPMTDELWAMIFPFGCPPQALGLGAVNAAPGALQLAGADVANGKLAFAAPIHVAPDALVLDSELPGATPDFLLALAVADTAVCVPCYSFPMPGTMNVTLDCPGIPALDGLEFEIQFDFSAGYCQWTTFGQSIPGGLISMQLAMHPDFLPDLYWVISFQADDLEFWSTPGDVTSDWICYPLTASGTGTIVSIEHPVGEEISFLAEAILT